MLLLGCYLGCFAYACCHDLRVAPKKSVQELRTGACDILNSIRLFFLCLQPSQNLVEPWWNPDETLVEPLWNPRGTLPHGRPGPPRRLRPQSFQLLGKNPARFVDFPPMNSNPRFICELYPAGFAGWMSTCAGNLYLFYPETTIANRSPAQEVSMHQPVCVC